MDHGLDCMVDDRKPADQIRVCVRFSGPLKDRNRNIMIRLQRIRTGGELSHEHFVCTNYRFHIRDRAYQVNAWRYILSHIENRHIHTRARARTSMILMIDKCVSC